MTTEFYFDPNCPWTWMTSRWLVEVAAERNLDIRWKPLSLAVLNGYASDKPVPLFAKDFEASFRTGIETGMHFLRVVAALDAKGRSDLAGAFYTHWGARRHHDGDGADRALLDAVAADAGVDRATLAAADDPSLDEAVRASTEFAMSLAGPDVGSPVVRPDATVDRAMFGPIMSPPPTGAVALGTWDAFVALVNTDGMFEAKRGRRGGPQFGRRPTV